MEKHSMRMNTFITLLIHVATSIQTPALGQPRSKFFRRHFLPMNYGRLGQQRKFSKHQKGVPASRKIQAMKLQKV
ncbi:hypothetical protein KIN20_021593 [Parelaphostrongylus tenuis]|uniref:Uncharacterized protein n=1 Tax=Parelaphostrongylus tenuis TaxID=148309 RepID=A0AAD5QRP3_PARTN|nr:hypothetical protein KIN20_021593 [Parelaphostrongylus tenuis]